MGKREKASKARRVSNSEAQAQRVAGTVGSGVGRGSSRDGAVTLMDLLEEVWLVEDAVAGTEEVVGREGRLVREQLAELRAMVELRGEGEERLGRIEGALDIG